MYMRIRKTYLESLIKVCWCLDDGNVLWFNLESWCNLVKI